VSPGAVRMLPALNISMDEALGAAEKLEQVLLSMT
jgi:hypothetical protein